MSFFDPMMVSSGIPENWSDYEIHVEVNSINTELIKHLEKTGWENFSLSKVEVGLDGSRCHYFWYGLNSRNLK